MYNINHTTMFIPNKFLSADVFLKEYHNPMPQLPLLYDHLSHP